MNNKNITTGAIIIALVAFVWIAYQGYVVVPQNKIEAVERQQQEERRAELMQQLSRENDYAVCKQDAYENYSNDWDRKCENVGKQPDCTLMAYEYEIIEQRYNKAKADCLSVFEARK